VANASCHRENKLLSWEGEAGMPNTDLLGFEILIAPNKSILWFSPLYRLEHLIFFCNMKRYNMMSFTVILGKYLPFDCLKRI
jgi:hypothetical protein